MSSFTERISDIELGERLRKARDAAKVKQADAADAIGVARTTIIAMEQGQRRVKLEELHRLARLYKTTTNHFLRREAVHADLVPQFRKLENSSAVGVEYASQLLNTLVSAELELENVLGVTRQRNYPPERPILPGDLDLQAELDAQELRNWLGLGPGPILDLLDILELQLGFRIYLRKLEAGISGLFAYDDVVGACMILNSNHPAERILQTAAHELCHFLTSRKQPTVFGQNEKAMSREEKYARRFSQALLTPSQAVKQKFAELTSGQSHFTRRHVILLASNFGVSREAIVRRLEELTLVKPGTWEWFEANGGITNQQAKEVIGESDRQVMQGIRSAGLVPHRLALLAREVYKRDLYSEGQLAQLLHLTRHEVREVLDGIEAEAEEAHEQFEIIR